jgi:hypothetical protein
MTPLDHIEDSDLREVYGQITSNPYAVVRARVEGFKDRLAAAEAKHEAVRVILDDFNEHGGANRHLFGGHRRAYFERLDRELKTEIAQRRRRGEQSDVFDRYRKAYDAELDRAAQQFMDEMDAEEAQSRALANEMVQAENLPSLIIKALEKLSRTVFVGPPASDTIQGTVHNALRDCAMRKDFASGGRIVLAYAKVSRWIRQGTHYDALVGSAAIVAREKESRSALWEVLVSDPPKDSRLSYNLACNAAIARDKERLLKYTRISLGLGKEKDQFMADPDFAQYLRDKEFLALFGAPRRSEEE